MTVLTKPIKGAIKFVDDIVDSFRKGKEKNVYLEGNYAPVSDEVFQESCIVLEGKVPEDISGSFVRNGPNPKYEPKGLYHWFDGDGMVHRVQIKEGKMNYANHQTRTKKLACDAIHRQSQMINIGDMVGRLGILKILLQSTRQFLGDRTISNIEKDGSVANTSLLYHNDKLLALVESSYPTELKLLPNGRVETVGVNDFEGRLRQPFTAHPKVDPVTKELMFFGYRLFRSDNQPFVEYGVLSSDGKTLKTVDIGVDRAIMMHDFAITENYSCFFDLPLIFSPNNLVSGGGAFVFKPKERARIGVLPRHGISTEMKWFDVLPCAVFHTANAYEEQDENQNRIVVIQACRLPKVELFDLVDAETEDEGTFYEWRLNLETGKVSEGELCQIFGEFPILNPKFLGRKHRYVWLAKFYKQDRSVPRFEGISKVDCIDGKVVSEVIYGNRKYGGECGFIAKSDPKSEDDGYICGFVHDESDQTTEFWVLDALDMTIQCKVRLSRRVPYGFHGIWINEDTNLTRSKL